MPKLLAPFKTGAWKNHSTGKISTGYLVASLPESKSFVRVIQIPPMGESEAENAVPFEAESFIPLPLIRSIWIGSQLGESGDKMNILIIATPKILWTNIWIF